MFAVIRTAIRVREWNRQISKYKKLSARGQVKDAEYIQSNQGEGTRMTRQRAAELFPDENFPEQMSDADLLAYLSQPEPEPETEASQIELVSMELNHLAAILHVYAGGLNFIK